MAHNSAISTESFEEILTWLDADRETAAAMYVQLRHDLIRTFVLHHCSDAAEDLTDEVFDRIANKVHYLRNTFDGNPRLYFYGVANNVIREHHKRNKTHVSLENVNVSSIPIGADESKEKMQTILEDCLEELPKKDRQLILGYYRAEKKRDVQKLAANLKISRGNLRVKLYRIRQRLLRKLLRKMEKT